MHANLAAIVAQKIAHHPGYHEFERWCQSQLMPASQIYFLVWQASRDALVVELPQEDGMDGHLWAPDVVAAIEAAGVKVLS